MHTYSLENSRTRVLKAAITPQLEIQLTSGCNADLIADTGPAILLWPEGGWD